MFQEISEREIWAYNALVYGLSDSSATPSHRRVSDDNIALEQSLGEHSNIIPKSTIKLIRLGKVCPGHIRPLKTIFFSKEELTNLIQGFIKAKFEGASFSAGLQIVRDKITHERGLLRSCHSELDRRIKSGDVGLRIRYINSVPKGVRNPSKNEYHPQDHSINWLQS